MESLFFLVEESLLGVDLFLDLGGSLFELVGVCDGGVMFVRTGVGLRLNGAPRGDSRSDISPAADNKMLQFSFRFAGFHTGLLEFTGISWS